MSAIDSSRPTPQLRSPVLLAPGGGHIVVTQEMFDAVRDFVDQKRTGSVQINFADGGFASVEAVYRKSYKKNKNGST